MASDRNKVIWAEVVARAWRDASYKEQLLANPKSVLTEAGMSIPESISIEILASTENVHYLVIPEPPKGQDGQPLNEEQLDLVAGGDSVATSSIEVQTTTTTTTAEVEVEAVEAEAVYTTSSAAAEVEAVVAGVVVLI